MPGLIEEIQKDAIDPKVSISTLLRKVKVAASKLHLPPTERWVEQELNGYTEPPLPSYRELAGHPKAFNPYRGWIPIIFEQNDLNEMISTCKVSQSVASLEALVENNKTNVLQFPFTPGQIMEINRLIGHEFGTMAIHLSTSQVHGLLDAVRNLVLEWALKLDRAGVRGDGFSFNKEERRVAESSATTFNIGSIGSMIGNLGSHISSGAVSTSGITANQLQGLAEQLSLHVEALKAAGADAELLDKSLSVISKQSMSNNPQQPEIRNALADLRNALSGAAGNLIASGAIALIARMLGG
jgi:hypothetical protein